MILTARDDICDRVKGLDGGADEYIGKPFALEELLARLRLIIRRQSGSAKESDSGWRVSIISVRTGDHL